MKGDVARVYLKSAATGVSHPAGDLPAGTYSVEVFFDEQPETLRHVDLVEGQAFSITCNQKLRACK